MIVLYVFALAFTAFTFAVYLIYKLVSRKTKTLPPLNPEVREIEYIPTVNPSHTTTYSIGELQYPRPITVSQPVLISEEDMINFYKKNSVNGLLKSNEVPKFIVVSNEPMFYDAYGNVAHRIEEMDCNSGITIVRGEWELAPSYHGFEGGDSGGGGAAESWSALVETPSVSVAEAQDTSSSWSSGDSSSSFDSSSSADTGSCDASS